MNKLTKRCAERERHDTRCGRSAAQPPGGRGARVRAAFAAWLIAAVAACADPITEPSFLRPPIELPPDLAAVVFVAQGKPTAPYVMLEISQPDGVRGFVAVDRGGRPVWFFRTEGGPVGFTRRQNGNFVFLDNARGLLEVTVEGVVVRELPQATRPGRFIHHDVVATPQNTILFIAEDVQPWNGAPLTGEAIWEWTPETGAVVKRWSSFDHFDPDVDRGPRSRPEDWLHANALHVGPRGNVLISFHFLDQVVSIAPGFGGLEWRLGGVNATLPVDDPFSGQHTAAEVAPGRVLLFDNGYAREAERYSRAIELELDGSSARKVWEWRPERDNWARIISSARRLPSGNTLVGFGMGENAALGTTGPIEVYEVTPEGDVVWHLELGGQVGAMYRATPLFYF